MILFALLVFFPVIVILGVYIYSVVPVLIKGRFLFLSKFARKIRKKNPNLPENVEDFLIDIEVRFDESEKKFNKLYVESESETFIDLLRSWWFFWTMPGCILCWIVLKMTESWEIGTYFPYVWPITWEFVHMKYSFWIMIVLLVALKLAMNRIKISSEFETNQKRYKRYMDLLPDKKDEE